MSHGDTGPGRPPQASQLEELLECEQELADELAVAELRARQLIEDARKDAEAAEAELEALLEDEAASVRWEVRETTQRRIRELQAAAEEQATLFEQVSDAEVERLAELAFRRLLAWEAES